MVDSEFEELETPDTEEFTSNFPTQTVNNELDTPDVEEEDLISSLRHKAVDSDTGEPPNGAPKPKAEPKVKGPEEEEPEQDAAPEPEAEEDEPEKEIKKPWGRIRRLEKERNSRDDQINTLSGRVEKLAAALERYAAKGVEAENADAQPEDDAVDPETDPAGAILQEQRAIRQEIAELKATRLAEQQARLIVETLDNVNTNLQSEVVKAEKGATESEQIEGRVFLGAITHAAGILKNSVARQFPDLNEKQWQQIVADSTNRTKLEWASKGLNPVEEMYKFAMDLGFDPDAYEASLTAQKAPQAPETQKAAPAPKEDAKAAVSRARDKAASVASTGGVEGGKPHKSAAKRLQTARTEEEFDFYLDQMLEAGEMRRDRTSLAGTPPFSELLAGKGVKMR